MWVTSYLMNLTPNIIVFQQILVNNKKICKRVYC